MLMGCLMQYCKFMHIRQAEAHLQFKDLTFFQSSEIIQRNS